MENAGKADRGDRGSVRVFARQLAPQSAPATNREQTFCKDGRSVELERAAKATTHNTAFRTCISAGCSHSHSLSLRTGGSVDPANVCADWMTTASPLAIGSFAAFAAWVTSGQSQTAISWCQTRTSHFL